MHIVKMLRVINVFIMVPMFINFFMLKKNIRIRLKSITEAKIDLVYERKMVIINKKEYARCFFCRVIKNDISETP